MDGLGKHRAVVCLFVVLSNTVLAFLSCDSDSMVSSVLRAVIMGLPGSGKGTISQRIVKDFNMYHLSSGDLLRSQIANKTDIGLKAKAYVDKGQFVPDDVMIALILAELEIIGPKSWLLDGFPRTYPQAQKLQKKQSVDLLIYLDVPIEKIASRIAGRMTHVPSGRTYNDQFNPPKVPWKDDVTGEDLVMRDDDKPEVVTKRLETYQKLTAPMVDFYRGLGVLKNFSGETSNVIWPKVHEYLSTKIEPHQFTRYQ